MTKYKELNCEICNKKYLSNYFYTHKKSKIHQKKCVGLEIKEQLLKDQQAMEIDNNNIKEIIKGKLDIINVNLNEIYKLLENNI
jgi:hypothetical protein